MSDNIAERLAEIRETNVVATCSPSNERSYKAQLRLQTVDIPWLCDTVERLAEQWECVRGTDQLLILNELIRMKDNA